MDTEKPGELNKSTARLGTEPLRKLLFRLSVPSMVSMIAMSLYFLADMFWLGRLSYQAIAAVTIIFPFDVMVFAVGYGSGVGVNALASRRFGEGNVEATNRVAGQAFPLSVFFGLIFLVASLVFGRQIASLLGATPEIIDLTVRYLSFFAWGIPFIVFRVITRNVFQAAGDAMKPMIFTVVGSVVNAALDPFLIFGWGPFPEMGIGGAGLATAIAGAVACTLSCYFLLRRQSLYRVRPRHLKPDFMIITQIYRVGLPSMLMNLTEAGIFLVLNRIVAGFGSLALAALGIAASIADLAFIPVVGIAHALLPIVGFCFGARLWKRMWAAVRQGSLIVAGVLGAVTILLAILAPRVIAIFNDTPELLAIAVPGMRIFISALFLIGPTIMFIITFQGLSKGWTATALSLVRQLAFLLPALLILPRFLGLTGVWMSLPISDVGGAVVAGLWLYREYRLQKSSGIWNEPPVTEPAPQLVPREHQTLD